MMQHLHFIVLSPRPILTPCLFEPGVVPQLQLRRFTTRLNLGGNLGRALWEYHGVPPQPIGETMVGILHSIHSLRSLQNGLKSLGLDH